MIRLHRSFAPLRTVRRADGLPSIAAAVALAVGVVSLASALTPNIAWRGKLLLHLEPVESVPVFHTLAVPLSIGLIVTASCLRLRRRRAWQAAVGLLLGLAVVHVLKGLDLEEAALALAAAGLLWWGRAAFYVRPRPLTLRSPMAIALGLVAAATMFATAMTWLATKGAAEPLTIFQQTVDMLSWTKGSVQFKDEMGPVPLVVELAGLVAVVIGAWVIFRPLAAPEELPDAAERETALKLVRAHGRDTLAFFKLRQDTHYLFSSDRRAFLGYRAENGVLLVAGDPVGPDDALPGLVRDTFVFAELHGLKLGVLNAGETLLPLWREAGMKTLYLGDEAIVETARFSLEGRAIRKVRQSVSRLEKLGYTAQAVELRRLDAPTLAELEHVSALWRGGEPERGFSMAMDSIGGAHQKDSVVVVARDGDGRVRGFLHFVPTFGRRASSLSFMRRDRETPNGLTEFLVVRAIELLQERGVEELSLNFAAFARFLERPAGRFERVLGRIVSLGNPFFQIESIYRFDAKFSPRWEPRYLVYEGPLALPRVGLAAMRIEGQLPRLRR